VLFVKRSAGEWAGLAVAFVVAGALVVFGVTVIGSLLALPPAVLVLTSLVALVAIGYPIVRMSPSSGRAAVTAPASPAAEDPHVKRMAAGAPHERNDMSDSPLVAIIMGSESDRAVMEDCEKALAELGVPFETVVASAHRQPAKVHEWASGLADRGVKVVIAAAGKAAHLGGVVAAYTPLPVIAVPMKTSDLGGLDSLLSMVQMPSGVPVACVAINGARNAAVLAAQILGTSMPEYRERIEAMKRDMADA
jgi:5-(carboxyamino)imidazole ribonucleotide mutase